MSQRSAASTRLSLGDTAIVGLAVIVAGLLFFTPTIFNDPDTYWHVATGEWVLRHRLVPTTDPFSWSFTGRLWTAHEWLAEVVMALAYSLADWRGLAILTGLAAAALVLLIGLHLRRALSARAALVFLIFVAFGMAPSLLARPHLLALPLLAFWTMALMEARGRDRAPNLWLLPLMLVWANLHASFIVGLALIGPFALEALIERPIGRLKALRDWAAFGVAALLLTLVNPQGVQGLLHPFQIMNMAALPSIVEWRSTQFDSFTPFHAVLFEGLFFALWLGVRVPVLRLVVLLGLLYMALAHVRQQIVFIVVAALILRDPFAEALKARFAPARDRTGGRFDGRLAAYAVAALLVGTCAIRLALPLERNDDVVTPRAALAAVPADVRLQRVLNGYNFGGYLIFEGVPTYIDGRADIYGDAGMARDAALRTAQPAKLAAELDAMRIGWSLLEPGDPLVRSLDRLEGWRRLHADRYAVVHVRSAKGSAK